MFGHWPFPPPPDFGDAAVRELRDEIAIAAMQAMLTNGYNPANNCFESSDQWHQTLIANNAYCMAREMLEAREKYK